MKRALAVAFSTATMAGVVLVGGAGGAQAAHCTDNGGPGHSDFAAHVRANNGPGGHNEGMHKGWASCEENSANFGG
jgi:hypothetical protein